MPLALHSKTNTVPLAQSALQVQFPKDWLGSCQTRWSSTWLLLPCPWHSASPPCALCHLWHFSLCCELQPAVAISPDVLSSFSWLIIYTLISACIKKEKIHDENRIIYLLHSPKNCQFQILSINLWKKKGGAVYHKLEQGFCSLFFSDVWIVIYH